MQWVSRPTPHHAALCSDRDPATGKGRAARRRQGARVDRRPDQDVVVAGLGLGRRKASKPSMPRTELNWRTGRLKLAIVLARELIGTAAASCPSIRAASCWTHESPGRTGAIEPGGDADRQVIEWDKDDIDA